MSKEVSEYGSDRKIKLSHGFYLLSHFKDSSTATFLLITEQKDKKFHRHLDSVSACFPLIIKTCFKTIRENSIFIL